MTDDLPGVEALRDAGYSIDELAAVTGFETARTFAELSGRRSLSDRTMDALRGMLSPHGAEAIAGFAGTSRAAYLEQVQAGRM